MKRVVHNETRHLSDTEADGVEAVVRSMIELIEPCIRQRVCQWMEVVKNELSKKG